MQRVTLAVWFLCTLVLALRLLRLARTADALSRTTNPALCPLHYTVIIQLALSRKEAGRYSPSLLLQTPRAYYSPGALKGVPPALRIISMPSSALKSGVVFVALRCPRLDAASTAAPALASSGAS